MPGSSAASVDPVWIDDETERLIRIIEASPPSPDNEKVLDDLQASLLSTLIGPFGLSADLLQDVDGGNVTTLHNFEQGVTANAGDRSLHDGYVAAQTEKFERKDYDAKNKKERKALLQQPGPIVDAYTHKELPRDGRAQRDHVVSASEVERSSKGHFAQTRPERVETANQDANLAWAEGSMNQSKGDKPLPDWADKTSNKDKSKKNAEAYDVDRAAMTELNDQAREAVNTVQDRAVRRKNVEDLALQGGIEAGKVALRQVLGLALRSLLKGIVADVRQLAKEGIQDIEQIKAILGARARAVIAEMKVRWAEFLKEGLAAALSGLLSSLATFFINTFITTVRNVVTIVRELSIALIRALKVVVAPEPGMTGADKARVVLEIIGGAAATVIGLGAQEAITKLLQTLPLLAPFAEELGAVISGALLGVGSILLLLAFDHLKSQIAFRNKRFADVHRGQQIALLSMGRTCLMLETSASFIQSSYAELQSRVATHSDERRKRGDATDSVLDDYTDQVDEMSKLLISMKR